MPVIKAGVFPIKSPDRWDAPSREVAERWCAELTARGGRAEIESWGGGGWGRDTHWQVVVYRVGSRREA